MPKGNVTLYVDTGLYEDVSKTYKVSRLVDIMLQSYVSDETADVTLTLQLNQIDATLEEIISAKRSAEKIVEESTARINYLTERRQKLKEDFQHAKSIRVRSMYYNEFNGICINCDFELEKVLERGAELIAKIKLVDPTFDPKARMERYKKILDEY